MAHHTTTCNIGRRSLQLICDTFSKLCDAYTRVDLVRSGVPAHHIARDLAGTPIPHGAAVTVFHTARVPPLSLYSLATTLCDATEARPVTAAAAVSLALRYLRVSRTAPSLHTVHRLFTACMLLVIKTEWDRPVRLTDFAVMAGVCAAELRAQEREIVDTLDWSVRVTAADLQSLVGESRELSRAAEPCAPVQSPFTPLPAMHPAAALCRPPQAVHVATRLPAVVSTCAMPQQC